MNRRFITICHELNRRALGAGVPDEITPADVEAAFNAGRWQCSECGRKHSELRPLTLTHIFPLGPGRIGRNTVSNLRLVCTDRCTEAAPAPVAVFASRPGRQRASLQFVHVNVA